MERQPLYWNRVLVVWIYTLTLSATNKIWQSLMADCHFARSEVLANWNSRFKKGVPNEHKCCQCHKWQVNCIRQSLIIRHPTDASSFRFTSIGPTIPEICPIDCLIVKKHIPNVQRIFGKKMFPTEYLQNLRIPPKPSCLNHGTAKCTEWYE